MIVFLREKFIAQIFMWIIAIVFVIGSFLLYTTMSGNSSAGPGDDDVVLKINGAKVRRGEFERLVSNHLQRQQQQGQAGLTTERDEIEQQVIDQIIQEQIYLNGAQFSDAEIEEGIRRNYSHLLGAYNASNPQERNYIRQFVRLQMSFEALRNQFEGLNLITDTEIVNEYRLQNDKAKLKYIQFQHTSYTSAVNVEDADIASYFEEHKDDYKIDDRINLRVIKLDPRDFVTDESVRAYYDERKGEFTTPEAVKARHILAKFPDSASDEQKAEVKARAEELLEKVKTEVEAGTDFADLAKEHSEDAGSAPSGGALRGRHPKLPPGDYFARGDMVAPFEKACFEELQPGEVSGLVESQFGFHIIKLEERKPEEIQTFDSAEREIRDKLIQIDGVDEAKTVAEFLLFDVEYQDFEAAAKGERYSDLSVLVQDTGWFSQDATNIPQVGSKWTYRGLIDQVFNMEVGVSDIIEAKKGNGDIEAYFVARVLEKKVGGVPALEDTWTASPKRTVKEQVVEDIKKERAQQMAREDAERLFGLRGGGESLEELLKKYEAPQGVTKKEQSVEESRLFAISPTSDFVSGLGASREVMFAAFNMDIDAVGGPFAGNDSEYLIQLVERQVPDMEKFESDPAEKTKIRRSLLQSKKSQVFNSWYNTLKKQAQITDNRSESS